MRSKLLTGLLLISPIISGSVGFFSSSSCSPAVVKESDSIVTMTTYSISRGQTDSNPLETASGYILSKKNPKKHRVIAISRDLKKKFKFSDSVLISNAGKYDGVYVVEDVMNKRFTNKIDILVNPKDSGTKIYNVKIKKL